MDFGYTERDTIKAPPIMSPAEEKLRRAMRATGYTPRRAAYVPYADLTPDEVEQAVIDAFEVVARLIADDPQWAEYLAAEVAKHG